MRVGGRGRSRGVESCGLASTAKLLRWRLVLHAEQHPVMSSVRCLLKPAPEGRGTLTLCLIF